MCCREGTDGDLGTAIDCATDSELSYKRVERVSYTICQVQSESYFINIMNKIKELPRGAFSGQNRHPMLRRAVGPQLGGAGASASGESSRKLVANS